MANLRDKVNVEMENISVILRELSKVKDKPNKSLVELAGIATFLHNIYNGVENILKQMLISQATPIPNSDSWHQDLLTKAAEKMIIIETTKKQLAKYLAFRHFFVHGYGFLLDEKELNPLVENIFNIYTLSLVSKLDNITRRVKHFEIRICFGVIPAKAGIQARRFEDFWMPASAGMTANLDSNDTLFKTEINAFLAKFNSF